jgi:D-arabinose 1-dehydrogenase-like Zn-dependent alcohol dehydrogenase
LVDALAPSAGGRLSYVTLTGDEDVDTEAIKKASPGGKGIDIYIDFTPPRANSTTHITAGFKSLRVGGQISIMGGLFQGVTFPYSDLVFKSIKIKGKYMYERADIEGLIRLVEAGILKVGKKAGLDMFGPYRLDQIQEAISMAEANGGWGSLTSIAPTQY